MPVKIVLAWLPIIIEHLKMDHVFIEVHEYADCLMHFRIMIQIVKDNFMMLQLLKDLI